MRIKKKLKNKPPCFQFILQSHNRYIKYGRIKRQGDTKLENNLTTTTSNPPNEGKPRSRRKLLIAVTAVAVAGLAVTALLASALLSSPTGQNAWLFKGAYAKYAGSTSVMGYGFDFSIRLEVLDFNSTHAYMSTSFKMESNIGGTAEEENSTWVELSKIGFANAFSETNVTNAYEATIDFGTLGKRDCTVYEYITDGPTMTVYVDKTIGWPLKMKLTMNGEESISLSLDIVLVDSNIPGL